ncbi:MAG: ABC transporter ATP-binding protein [Methanomicrobiales archaeon]|jgi:peptide/nickel transport system ATP-binding protein|nr:ABC transporter ATP-binding protein [Methanomicrobiales archaeon]
MKATSPFLEITDLSITFCTPGQDIPAVSKCSFTVKKGTCMAIIGESGCGKSVIAHAILRILPKNSLVCGTIRFRGCDLYQLEISDMEKIRGSDIGIMFQSPDRALNPIYKIYRQVKEPVTVHQTVSWEKQHNHILSMLKKSGFFDPEKAASLYPCQCSGGMNQRAVTAIVLSLKPELVIADEPTKGLDTARISDVQDSLMEVIHEDRTLLLITHDIRLARTIATDIVVMYAGEIVESGLADDVLSDPLHPYTKGLIQSLPENGFIPIPGYAPPLTDLPKGCRFAQRCPYASDICHIKPAQPGILKGRVIRCHQY